MNVLVLNSGSSSIKYQLINMPSEKVVCKGLVDRIGFNDANFRYKTTHCDIEKKVAVANHKTALTLISEHLLDKNNGVITTTNEIDVVGHRVVHGGKRFVNTTKISQEIKDKIKQLSSLAPLHNPHNLAGIIFSEEIFKNAKQVAVFDTSFHQTIPVKAKKYAIPNHFYDEKNIQLYGFHGISHQFVSEMAIAHLKKNDANLITIHLGNGCSMTAVKNGKSIDHSLGFGPVNGLIMGTRSGDIDQAIIFYLINTLGYSVEEVNTLLVKKSGMLGLTGYSDLREIEAAAASGNKACNLALDMAAYRIQKYIGSYTAALNGLDAIVFTAGIGENSPELRKRICSNMDYFGIAIDPEKNEKRVAALREINTTKAKTKVLVIPTNEELEIAKQAYAVCNP